MGYYFIDVPSATQARRPKNAYPGFSGIISGCRYYNSEIGKWISLDPILELGSQVLRSGGRTLVHPGRIPRLNQGNLYGFVDNSPTVRYDALGLLWPELIAEKIVECGSSTVVQWVADVIANALRNLVMCDVVIEGNCALEGPPDPRRHIDIDMKIGTMPSHVARDFAKCMYTLGIAPPKLNFTQSSEMLFRCIHNGVRYSIWTVVTISDDEGNSTTLRQYVDGKDCGESTACICRCPR